MCRKHFRLLLLFAVVLYGSSCVDTKMTTYFNDLPNEVTLNSSAEDSAEHRIQNNDQLSIHITSLNEDADKIYNQSNNFVVGAATAGGRAEASGYLVSSDGFVEINGLGRIKAAGLTKKELKNYILKTINDRSLLKEPVVDIRFLNYQVTIIGEVFRPQVITVPDEKISLIKALGIAGDITIYGKKENVMLIRENNGKKFVKRLNLNSKEFLSSSFYYLQPNDVVYVEANKNKVASTSSNRILIPAMISALSVVVIILDRLIK